MFAMLKRRLSLLILALSGAAASLFCLSSASAQSVTLQDLAKATEALPEIVIYPAKEIVTLDPANPTVQAVAVVGDRILAVGQLDELKAAAGKQPYSVNTTFADQVIVARLHRPARPPNAGRAHHDERDHRD